MVFERKTEPKFRIGRSRKRTKKKTLSDTFLAGRGPKTDLKMDPEIHKKRSLAYVYITRKTTQFQKHFFLDFPVFRGARSLKIKPNHCRVDQKRGYHPFLEKTIFEEIPPKVTPQGTPETTQNRKKHLPDPF